MATVAAAQTKPVIATSVSTAKPEAAAAATDVPHHDGAAPTPKRCIRGWCNWFGGLTITFQVALIILFGTCTVLDPSINGQVPQAVDGPGTAPANQYAMFQDTHVMMAIGFGFLYVLLRRYAWSGVSINLLILVFVEQWAILNNGFWDAVAASLASGAQGLAPIPLTLLSYLRADYTAATVLISFGAVLGRVSPLQMVALLFWEVIVAAINGYIGTYQFLATDPGGSCFIHVIGAATGLSLSWALGDAAERRGQGEAPSTTRHNGTFAMIGTLFLFCFWPSFNAGALYGAAQTRAMLNTVASMAASVATAFAASRSINGQWTDYDIQNATLAGGVIMGAACDMILNPWGAMLAGAVAGVVSVYGFNFLTPWVKEHLKITDTCGILNLHLIPGVMGGIAAAIAAGGISAGTGALQWSPAALVAEFPGRAAGRSAGTQAGFQLALLVVSLALGIVCGLTGGLLLRLPCFEPKTASFYEDAGEWNVPDEEEEAPELLALAAASTAAAIAAARSSASPSSSATSLHLLHPAAILSSKHAASPDRRNSPRWQPSPSVPRVPTMDALEVAGRAAAAGGTGSNPAQRPQHGASPRWSPAPSGGGSSGMMHRAPSNESGLDLGKPAYRPSPMGGRVPTLHTGLDGAAGGGSKLTPPQQQQQQAQQSRVLSASSGNSGTAEQQLSMSPRPSPALARVAAAAAEATGATGLGLLVRKPEALRAAAPAAAAAPAPPAPAAYADKPVTVFVSPPATAAAAPPLVPVAEASLAETGEEFNI